MAEPIREHVLRLDIVNLKKLHNIVPFLMSILGIYVSSLGIDLVFLKWKPPCAITFWRVFAYPGASFWIPLYFFFVIGFPVSL